jgi:hypothetical protein
LLTPLSRGKVASISFPIKLWRTPYNFFIVLMKLASTCSFYIPNYSYQQKKQNSYDQKQKTISSILHLHKIKHSQPSQHQYLCPVDPYRTKQLLGHHVKLQTKQNFSTERVSNFRYKILIHSLQDNEFDANRAIAMVLCYETKRKRYHTIVAHWTQ